MNWDLLADRAFRLEPPTRDEALHLLQAGDEEFLPILHAAFRVRRHFHGMTVKLHVLLNAKSGLCPEDCGFCSQSAVAETPIERYRLLTKDEMVAAARKAREARAWKFCIVTSTRGPTERELETICAAAREIKRETGLRLCTSLGSVTLEQARRLKDAGVDRFNHNLETSQERFPEICTTHTWQDRWDNLQRVREAGMEVCTGGIIGMGEGDEDIVAMAFDARRGGADSIPVNFLDPRPGTAMSGMKAPDPRRCLRILSLYRLVNPDKDVRLAGGREVNLRSLQALALWPCNSIFTSGYLTTGGNIPSLDHQMIRDAGFEILEAPIPARG